MGFTNIVLDGRYWNFKRYSEFVTKIEIRNYLVNSDIRIIPHEYHHANRY